MRVLLLSSLVLCAGCDVSPPQERFRVSELLGAGDEAGFARAFSVRPFRFPADHGPHPGYRNEWWYLTGNLDGPDGEAFGFQATFFRIALYPGSVESPSAWRTGQVWMAHAALTDLSAGEHIADERFARQGVELAGAEAQPFRVWLEDWMLEDEGGAWRLRLPAEGFGLDLALEPVTPVILQGEQGLSRKSAAPGNASYYYSIPRFEVNGRIDRGGDEVPVTGLAWLDREWSTSALGPDQAGWDWFSLQLNDGRNLMYYRLRTKGGGADPHSAGSLSDGTGLLRTLGATDVQLRPLGHWQGYPVEWRLHLRGEPNAWRVRALLRDQEMDLSVRYWEGAVEVLSDADGTSLGRGYLELSGYR